MNHPQNLTIARIRIHALVHWMRDTADELQTHAENKAVEKYVENFKRFHDDVAERIAAIFRTIVEDDGINCAIRLADKSDDAKREYVTRGRSTGMDVRRKANSQPIPIDRGIARKLMDENSLGVTFINDIDIAVKENWWIKSPNDDLPDVRHLMVAPINCCKKDERSMLGILYVTSRRDNLTSILVEPMKAIADLLGFVYPNITGRFEQVEGK